MEPEVRGILTYLDIQIKAIEKDEKKEFVKTEDFDVKTYHAVVSKRKTLEQVKNWILKEFGG